MSGISPNVFKIAKVLLVVKAESRILCSNYRPIPLSNIGKIIEKLLHKRLNVFLEKKQIYYNFQFGFRSNLSTKNALLSIVESIQSHLDKNKFCAGVFVDLKKAFGTVDHHILLQKLEHYGIRGVANEWFSSYLKNRAQFVSIGNVSSTIKELLTGVPQGSLLGGPLLFLLYINDLHNSVKYAKTYHFADDTSVILSSTSLEILSKWINKDLFNLSNSLKASKLSLNVKKTELVNFRSRKLKTDSSFKFKLDGKRLVPTKTVKYLGVLLDKHLHWNQHISQVKMKLNRAIAILSKVRYNANLNVLKIIYHSLFGSHLLYGSQIWGQKNLKTHTTFQALQNCALKKITFQKRRDSATCIYKDLKILKFRDYITQQNCLFVFSIEQNPQLLSSFKIFHCILDIPYSQTYTYGTKSVMYSCIKDWNNFKRSFLNLFQGQFTYSRIKSVLTNRLLNPY